MPSFLTAILSFLSGLFDYFKQNQLVQGGEDKVVAKSEGEDLQSVSQAETIRAQAETAAALIPTSASLPDDGFRRD